MGVFSDVYKKHHNVNAILLKNMSKNGHRQNFIRCVKENPKDEKFAPYKPGVYRQDSPPRSRFCGQQGSKIDVLSDVDKCCLLWRNNVMWQQKYPFEGTADKFGFKAIVTLWGKWKHTYPRFEDFEASFHSLP